MLDPITFGLMKKIFPKEVPVRREASVRHLNPFSTQRAEISSCSSHRTGLPCPQDKGNSFKNVTHNYY